MTGERPVPLFVPPEPVPPSAVPVPLPVLPEPPSAPTGRPSDILALQQLVVATVRPRRSSRGGRHASEHLVRALRNLYQLAVRDELIPAQRNSALAVPLPRRLPSTRRALTTSELAEINHVVATGGRAPVLDSLLIRLHTDTACRRGGALALRVKDLDTRYCRALLREKDGTYRWQPITPTLAAALDRHATVRDAADPANALLRRANGVPLTTRRYDLLWRRVRVTLPWPTPTPDTPTPDLPPPTSAANSTKSPPPSPHSPANHTHSQSSEPNPHPPAR